LDTVLLYLILPGPNQTSSLLALLSFFDLVPLRQSAVVSHSILGRESHGACDEGTLTTFGAYLGHRVLVAFFAMSDLPAHGKQILFLNKTYTDQLSISYKKFSEQLIDLP
jgi:hypothetical protein